MKKIMIIAAIAIAGCSTTQQNTDTAFKTISAVDAGAKAAYGGLIVAAAQGLMATNNIPTITAAYKQLESDCLTAALVAQAGTNALAPANLTAELAALTTAIANVQPLTK